MGQDYIRDVLASITMFGQLRLHRHHFPEAELLHDVPMLRTDTRIDQDESVARLHQQRAHRILAEVILVRRIRRRPSQFRYGTETSSSIT